MKPELSALNAVGKRSDRGSAAEQRLADAAEDQHARQRHDEARYSVIGDPVALCGADRAADDQADDRHDQRIAEESERPDDHHHGGQRADEAGDRADAEIDMARHDDQQHAQRHDDDEAVLLDQIAQVDRLEQRSGSGELEEDHDGDQRQDQAIVAQIVDQRRDRDARLLRDILGDAALRRGSAFGGHDAFPSPRTMARMIFSWLASDACISPTMRPSFMT